MRINISHAILWVCWLAVVAWAARADTPSDSIEGKVHAKLQKKTSFQYNSQGVELIATLLVPEVEIAIDRKLKDTGAQRTFYASYPMSLDHVCVYAEVRAESKDLKNWKSHLIVNGEKRFLGSQLMAPAKERGRYLISACTRDSLNAASNVAFSITDSSSTTLTRVQWSAPWPKVADKSED